MNSELKIEILSHMNRIDSFLERASLMLTLAKQNQEFSRGLEFNEQELKGLDSSLELLAVKVLKSHDIPENIWLAPVKYAYRYSNYYKAGSSPFSWLESFHQGLSISKTFFSSYLLPDSPSITYNVKVEGSAGVNIGNDNSLVLNQIFDNNDIKKLINELSLLREEMKRQSTSVEQDMAIGSIAKAEIALKGGDKSEVIRHLKDAGKWAFDVATKIGVSVATKAIEQLIK